MRKTGPSTYDVARHAHVSVSTVPRVINGQRGVDRRTRAAVWRSIDALGYEVVRDPNVLCSILVLVPCIRFNSTNWQLMVSGILEEASRHGLPVMFAPAGSADDARREIQAASARDGVVGVVQAGFPTDVLAGTGTYGDREVVAVSTLMESQGHSVNVDMYDALRRVTHELAACGHRRIAMAIDELAWWALQQRLRGHLDALRELGLSIPGTCEEVPPRAARDWLVQQLSGPDRPTAIIAGTSQLSKQLFAELYRLRLRIPGELSFVGVGHTQSRAEVVFDTIAQPTFALGVEAVRLLRHLVTRRAGVVHRRLKAERLYAGTVGPPCR